MCAILPPEILSYGNVGLPVPCLEVKLIDVPDAGYLANGATPQGEICLRGPSVIKHYYKRPDLNEDPAIFAPDGWFRTGDVGQWNPNGTLSVIDRCAQSCPSSVDASLNWVSRSIKNLVKLSGGEYIALERLEAIYKSCNLVQNLCVYAHAEAKQPMAVIIPHEVHLKHVLRRGDLEGVDPEASLHELCNDPAVRKLVQDNCNALGKKNGFKPLEFLEAVVLTDDEWTPESELVTAAQKLQRKKIHERYKSEIRVSVVSLFPFRVHVLTASFRVFRKYIPTPRLSEHFCLLVILHRCVHNLVTKYPYKPLSPLSNEFFFA